MQGDRTDLEYVNDFIGYINEQYRFDIERILLHPDPSIHFGLPIDVQLWANDSPQMVAHVLLKHHELLPLLDESVWQVQQQLRSQHEEVAHMSEKRNVHARLWHLPGGYGEFRKPNISCIRASDAGRFISLGGTVVRTTMVKMLEVEKEFECGNCGHRFRVLADVDQHATTDMPRKCPSLDANRKGQKKCNSSDFTFVDGSRVCRDYQEVTVQERLQHLTVGSIPRSMTVVLQDDLVDVAKAGDDVILSGVIRRMWEPLQKEQRCSVSTYILANHVRVSNDDKSSVRITPDLKRKFERFWIDHQSNPLKGRNMIVNHICPRLCGLHAVKLSLLVTLIGGVSKVREDGFRTRGQSHLLIIGDPGTGKSQLLRWAAKVSSRSVFTTGVGTTRAGLTCSAVRDQGEWTLEAGALVLADGGVCCIDEFGCIRESDRATIHEAMEQQTLSIAKAGLVTKLNTRCTVFGVLNPKGTFDPDAELSVNCAIASPLLSRFDLILLMLDKQQPDWDSKVTKHIMRNLPENKEAELEGDDFEKSAATDFTVEAAVAAVDGQPLWTLEHMQAYLYYVRTSYQPEMTTGAMDILSSYYQLQRTKVDRNAARTTVRLLESIVRLAQGHARLMCRNAVLPQDAVCAILLVEASMTTASMIGITSGDSAHDPDQEYLGQESQLLERIGIDPQTIPPNERTWDYRSFAQDNGGIDDDGGAGDGDGDGDGDDGGSHPSAAAAASSSVMGQFDLPPMPALPMMLPQVLTLSASPSSSAGNKHPLDDGDDDDDDDDGGDNNPPDPKRVRS